MSVNTSCPWFWNTVRAIHWFILNVYFKIMGSRLSYSSHKIHEYPGGLAGERLALPHEHGASLPLSLGSLPLSVCLGPRQRKVVSVCCSVSMSGRCLNCYWNTTCFSDISLMWLWFMEWHTAKKENEFVVICSFAFNDRQGDFEVMNLADIIGWFR